MSLFCQSAHEHLLFFCKLHGKVTRVTEPPENYLIVSATKKENKVVQQMGGKQLSFFAVLTC